MMENAKYAYIFDTDISDIYTFVAITSDIVETSPGSECELDVRTKQVTIKNTKLLIDEIRKIFNRYQTNINPLKNS